MKTGLSMEGGAMRGMFTVGVLDVFMENGITFDGAAGISAGATFGCNFKSKQIGRAIRYNKKYGRDPRYVGMKSLIRTGDLYGAEFCYHELPEKLDLFDWDTFKENPMEFYVGATDIRTGRIVYHRCTDGRALDVEWMRASASMPVVSRIVRIGGYELLDGGIVDPVPLRFMEAKGYDRNVVILTQPADYRKKPSAVTPLVAASLARYPKVVKAMAVRHKVYNRRIAEIREKERAGDIFVIRPAEALHIKRTETDPDELERVYQAGRAEAEKRLEALRSFLKKGPDTNR